MIALNKLLESQEREWEVEKLRNIYILKQYNKITQMKERKPLRGDTNQER